MPRNVYWELFYHLVWRTEDSLPLITPKIAPMLHKHLTLREAFLRRMDAIAGRTDK